MWEGRLQIFPQTWSYEGCHIVQDLAVVPQGRILSHVVAESSAAANGDEVLVWATRVCSIEKHLNPKITISGGEIVHRFLKDFSDLYLCTFLMLHDSCSE